MKTFLNFHTRSRCLLKKMPPLPLRLMSFLLFISMIPSTGLHSQNDTPCECSQRWLDGAAWNPNGTVNESPPQNQQPKGIIKCGSSAETQSNINVQYSCNYQPSQFPITLGTCIDPSSGQPTTVIGPTAGQPIIWFNFDVRPLAGIAQWQINDNSGDNIGWALYYSSTSTTSTGPAPHYQSGDVCNSTLNYISCGKESSNTWNNLPSPNFPAASNYYLAVWDQDADGNLSINNFKSRFGCGDGDPFECLLFTGTPTTTCNTNGTYTLQIPISGINGEYYGYDPNANNLNNLSSPACITNAGSNPPTTSGTITLTYNNLVNYNVTIFEANDPDPSLPNVTPSSGCPDPINPGSCKAVVSGFAPICVLAVSLSSFDAYEVNCSEIGLRWVTSSETNNDRFEVQRSTDGVKFFTVGSVKGKNLKSGAEYAFIDSNDLQSESTYYYRLVQYDFDGKSEKHRNIKVIHECNTVDQTMVVYPNPTNDRLNVEFKGFTEGQPVTLIIYDATGKESGKHTLDPRRVNILDVKYLNLGYYHLKVVGLRNVITSRFIKMDN